MAVDTLSGDSRRTVASARGRPLVLTTRPRTPARASGAIERLQERPPSEVSSNVSSEVSSNVRTRPSPAPNFLIFGLNLVAGRMGGC